MPAAGSRQGCRRKAEPDWAHVHRELRRPGVTLMLLWEEYRPREPDGYALQPLVRALPRPGRAGCRRPCGRRTRPASGCSSTMPARRSRSSTAGTGEVRAGADLRRRAWAPPATPTPRRPGRRRCRTGSARMSRALAFMGGVPAQLVPDNPKVGVDRANWYEPGLNRTYLDLAAHYGTAILPTRVRKPRDKAKVEVGRARGRALDPGAPAQPPLLLAGRAQRGDRRAGRRPQRAADAPARASAGATCSSSSTARRSSRCRPSPTTTPSGACAGSGSTTMSTSTATTTRCRTG